MRTQPGSYVIHAFFIAIIAALLFAIFSDKHLSADGAGYFARILEERTFNQVDWSRRFAEYLTQYPLVAAVTAEVRSLPLLRLIYGLGILAIWLAAWLAAAFALRGRDKAALLFFSLSAASVNLLSDAILAGEHQVMTLLSWPVLFFLLRKPPLGWMDAAVLLGMLALLSRSYSTAFAPALLFLLISLYRLSHAVSRKERAIYFGSAALAATAVTVSVYSVVFPRDPSNAGEFQRAFASSLNTPEGLAALAFAALFIFGWTLQKRVVLLASLLPVTAYMCYVIFTGHILSAGQSFGNRTYSLSLLPLWMLGAIWVNWMGRAVNWSVLLCSGAFAATMIAVSVISTVQWLDFKSQFITTLVNNEHLVPVEDTVLANSPVGWDWTYEALSVIWSDGCVHSVILNKEGARWQPKGPPESLILGAYTCYSETLAQGHPDFCKCD